MHRKIVNCGFSYILFTRQPSAEFFSPVRPFIDYWGRFSSKISTQNKLHNLVKIQRRLRIQAKLLRNSLKNGLCFLNADYPNLADRILEAFTRHRSLSHRTSTLRSKPLLSSFSLASRSPNKIWLTHSLARCACLLYMAAAYEYGREGRHGGTP